MIDPTDAQMERHLPTISLRDWFAGQAIQVTMRLDLTPSESAALAYRVADAMLKEREK